MCSMILVWPKMSGIFMSRVNGFNRYKKEVWAGVMKRDREGLNSELSAIDRYLKRYTKYLVVGLFALSTHDIFADENRSDQEAGKGDIAATVNGVPIDISVMQPQVEDKLRKYKKYGMRKSDQELQKFVKLQALESLIATELIYQEAKKIKIKDLDQRIDKSMTHVDDNQKESQEYDEEKMRQAMAKKIIIDEYLVKQKIKDYKVPEEEVMDYYNNNKKSFIQGDRIRSRHILVSVAVDAKTEDKEAAYKKIVEAKNKLQQGVPFSDVAKAFSDCNSASSGGELGYHERGYMPKAYDNIAFDLEIEKLSDIVETQHGYHIIEVLERQSRGVQPFEEVRDFISKYLNIEYQKRAMKDHISALRKKAKIEVYL